MKIVARNIPIVHVSNKIKRKKLYYYINTKDINFVVIVDIINQTQINKAKTLLYEGGFINFDFDMNVDNNIVNIENITLSYGGEMKLQFQGNEKILNYTKENDNLLLDIESGVENTSFLVTCITKSKQAYDYVVGKINTDNVFIEGKVVNNGLYLTSLK